MVGLQQQEPQYPATKEPWEAWHEMVIGLHWVCRLLYTWQWGRNKSNFGHHDYKGINGFLNIIQHQMAVVTGLRLQEMPDITIQMQVTQWD